MMNNIFPVIALKGYVLYPDTISNIEIVRTKSKNAIESVNINDRVLLVPQKDPNIDNPKVSDLNGIGVIAIVKKITKTNSGYRVLFAGEKRASIIEYVQEEGFFIADAKELDDNVENEILIEALVRVINNQFNRFVEFNPKFPKDSIISFFNENNPSKISNVISSALVKKDEDKIDIFNTIDLSSRLEKLIDCLEKELQIVEIEKDISDKVKSSVESNQKEYILREQMKVITQELGSDVDECEEYRNKIKNLKIKDKASKEKLEKEIIRLSKIPPNSPDSGIIRTYLDWVLDLPWNTQTKENTDISLASKILDEDHYGLQKVKERILEYLSVRMLNKNTKGSILCLVGPPGVGKTSIAKSIARATKRNFVRMSLGGVRDEAEIRGHRRTYVGAMPGRILYNMKNSKSINPVFLLDEIDKMASDYRGDPSSAMLEVLDPEINNTYRDNYLEIPYDLSKIIFITTANTLDTIPDPLLDRMEVISIDGYTLEEKKEIAKRYLINKCQKNCGLDRFNIILTDNAIDTIISKYTRESGVRNLEREILDVFRKIALKHLKNKEFLSKRLIIDLDVSEYLGKPKYIDNDIISDDCVGVCTGMAWTSVGGTTLNIEATTMSGKGDVILTGKLGDVMKESARTAISYIHSKDDVYNIPDKMFVEKDIHIHVPEGATPKDGPSAGITMATAILSALTGKKIRHNVAMTGEITLTGKVLPIGGLKEKILAATRVGIDTIIIPKDNEKDLEDIPKENINGVTIYTVSNIEEVFEKAIIL